MANRPKSLQELQRSGGINLTPKDKVYLRGIVKGTINSSHGAKMKYLRKRGYLNKSQELTPLGQAAVKAIKNELKRTQGRQEKGKEIERTRHEDSGGGGSTPEHIDPTDSG